MPCPEATASRPLPRRWPGPLRPVFPFIIGLVFAWRVCQGESVVIGVVGDFGGAVEGPTTAASELAVANLIKRWVPDFILTTGDNNYRRGAPDTIDPNIGQFYHDYIHPYVGAYGSGASSNRFFPCLGNHDVMTSNGVPYLNYFSLPGNERYYRYRSGPVEVFALNSNSDPDGTSSTSTQGRWLETQLAESTAQWKLVYFHHPPYSGSIDGAGNPEMRWPFAAWGASAVLSGHEHAYARIFTNGLFYFVNGAGGEDLEFGGASGGAVQVRYNADFGAMRLQATETNLSFHFITRNDLIIDTLVLGSPAASPYIVAPPGTQTVPLGSSVSFRVQATGPAPLRYQWQSNSVDLAGATNQALLFPNVGFDDEAEYRVVVMSGSASTVSRSGLLIVLRQPLITQQPASLTGTGGLSVRFTVAALGAGTLHYQWLFNGTAIAGSGATSPSLLLTNVLPSAAGDYQAQVTDDVGSVLSNPARLRVVSRPVVTLHPISQAAPVGGTVTFSVAAAGELPMNYSWRMNGRVMTNIMLNQGTCFWTIHNVQLTNAANYAVGITNGIGPAARLTSNAVLTVQADRDGDGMPDEWELAQGLNPEDASDAGLDPDGDGVSNLGEYLAGTDPNSGGSLLRIERIRVWPDGRTGIEFNAASNRTYAVEVRDEPRDGAGGTWQTFAEIVAVTTNRAATVEDPGPPAPDPARHRFYRLVTPRLR